MQNTFKLAAVAALCSTAVAAHADVAFDANLELDTTYIKKSRHRLPTPATAT